MPQTRRGTPWQVKSSVGGWFDTAKKLIASPGRMFESLRIDDSYSRKLLFVNLGIAALLMAHPLVGVFTFDPSRGRSVWTVSGFFATGLSAAVLWTVAMALLLGLTVIEYLGIRFFAARRQWRLLPQAALQICAHSAMAWIVSALLMIVGLSLSSFLPQAGANHVAVNFWEEIVDGLRKVLPGFPPLAGFLAGMLWFEWLVYIGVRCCKFANAPTLAAERTSG